MSRIRLPEYSMPNDLKEVLDNADSKLDPNSSEKCQTFDKILKALKSIDYVELSEDHYIQLSKLALYLEAYQSNIDDEKKCTMMKKRIVKCDDSENSESKLFKISVHCNEENKPLMKINDLLDVIDTTDNNTSYTMRITKVTRTHIAVSDYTARFSKTHKTEKFYDVKLQTKCDHNYPRRCAHYALWLINSRSTLTYLFPQKSKPFIKDIVINYSDLKAINPTIDSNPEQKQAIANIINKSSFPAPYILYGPPGTGKTATLVEAMCQVHKNFPERNILVCTPSNTAADEITKRLLKFVKPEFIYRIYSQSKDGSTIDEEIQKCSNYYEGKVVYATLENIVEKRIVISTICNSMRLILMRVPKDHFSYLIIDEAGHGTEPDILIPISLVSRGGEIHSQIVLAGDPQQLGPTIKSKVAGTILGRSILERIMACDTYQKDRNNKYNPNYITKLLRNYRSHPNIIHLSNKLFYENELIPMAQSSGTNEKFPVIFHGVESEEKKIGSSPSSCNPKEIQLVMKYIDDLLNNKLGIGPISAEEIGIVTPFALQSKMIQAILNEKKIKGINVGTVDLFQGQERKVMIMTTVRSKTFVHDGLEHIGFLSNSKRFNVAITRAKKMFIVIGNPNVLRIDDKWRMLLKFCMDNNSYQGIKLSSNQLSDDGKSISKALKIVLSSSLFGNEVSDLFELHEYDGNDDFLNDYENIIDSIADLDLEDHIYDNYDFADNLDIDDIYDNYDFAENWDIDDDDDVYNDYEDFIEPEDMFDNEDLYYDFNDLLEPEDLYDYDEPYNDMLEPENFDNYEEIYNDPDDLLEPEDLHNHDEICNDHYENFDHFDPQEFEDSDYTDQLYDNDDFADDDLVDAVNSLIINDDYDYY